MFLQLHLHMYFSHIFSWNLTIELYVFDKKTNMLNDFGTLFV